MISDLRMYFFYFVHILLSPGSRDFSEIKKWKYVGAKGEISKSKYSLLKYSFYNAYKRKYLFLFS